MFKRDGGSTIETLIGPGVTLRGDLEFTGGLHLEGRVHGHVRVAPGGQGSLAMGEAAVIEGDVQAQQAVLNGRVRGEVRVAGRLALGPRAVIEGNVHYGSIEMAAGARIVGKLLRSA